MGRYSVYCLMTLILMSGTELFARSGNKSQAGASAQVVDGAKTPEKIPDEVAYLMLFRTLADGPDAPEYKTRSMIIHNEGLSDADTDSIILAANEAMTRIASMELGVSQSTVPNDSKTALLQTQRNAILRDVAATLQLRLSSASATKFQEYLKTKVKTSIRIVP